MLHVVYIYIYIYLGECSEGTFLRLGSDLESRWPYYHCAGLLLDAAEEVGCRLWDGGIHVHHQQLELPAVNAETVFIFENVTGVDIADGGLQTDGPLILTIDRSEFMGLCCAQSALPKIKLSESLPKSSLDDSLDKVEAGLPP